ncbi:MAG: hypothetical protein NT004_06285 [Bacteroidetes bacterium]|nr:hypothetical protein [Bacteroidota bacterium]
MNHTIERHRRLYGLFRDTGTDKYHHQLVLSYSQGRTENSAELTDLETDELIRHLVQMVKTKQSHERPTRSGVDYQGQQMRRRILSLCYSMGWSIWNEQTQKHDVDWQKLNDWMLHYSYAHKLLNTYSYGELQRLICQFEKMASAVLASQPIKRQVV